MKLTFDEWCDSRRCSECEFRHLESWTDCKVAYENGGEITSINLKRIEKKLDAIIRHFNVPID